MAEAVSIDESTGQDHAATRDVNLSLLISTVGVITSVVVWWAVRFYNANAASEGRRMKDLLTVDWSASTLPFVLFVMFLVGVSAFALVLMGVAAASEGRQVPVLRAVIASALSAMLMTVPLVVLANSLVTAGLWNMGGMGD